MHGRMREQRKAASWLGTTPPALRRSGDPDVLTAVEAGDATEDRRWSGRGSNLERGRRTRNQAEPIFSAHKRGGSKGGRSCAAVENRRGGSISSGEAHRRRQLLPTASSARSKKTGARPPWTRRGTRQAMIVQKQGPEQPISRKRHAVHQLSRGASAGTTCQEMTMKAEIMCRHGRCRGHQPSYEANPKQERWTRPPMQRRTGQLTRGAP